MSPEALNGKEFAQIVPMYERSKALKNYDYAGTAIFFVDDRYRYDRQLGMAGNIPTVNLMLAADSDYRISLLSGHKEDTDNGSPVKTAIRETHEESLGKIIPGDIQGRIGNIPPLIFQRRREDGSSSVGVIYPIFIYEGLPKKGRIMTRAHQLKMRIGWGSSDDDMQYIMGIELNDEKVEGLCNADVWRNPHWSIPLFHALYDMSRFLLVNPRNLYDLYNPNPFYSGLVSHSDNEYFNLQEPTIEKALRPAIKFNGKIFFRDWFNQYIV